jgi:primosomal protein N' (replication factor Y)
MSTLFSHPEPEVIDERFVRVAVERAIDQAAGDGLTYRAGPDPPGVGERVEVPLGRGDRRTAGIVVHVGGAELLADLPPDRVKRILRRTGSGLPAPLVELARWIADYYIAPLGMVLAAMMPTAVKQSVGRRTVVLLHRAPPDEARGVLVAAALTPSAARAWERISTLADAELPLEPRELSRRAGARNLGPIHRLIKAGLLRPVSRETVRSRVPEWARLSVEAAGTSRGHRLTQEQERIVQGVAGTLGGFAVHLLRGVTSSGKTEVYLRLIDHVLSRGHTALVLVPEIALTPQTAGRFVERFGGPDGRVAVMHSGLSASQRHKAWASAATGQAQVVVGARSAVFAPMAHLGLIVVDEEHDSSGYKQDQVPRYHGRDVAIKRGQIEGCPVLLGSATPSLESWANATGVGPARFRLWELTERVGGGALPRVEVVDMVEERRRRSPGSSATDLIGPTLAEAIVRTVESDGQAILLLNRRGYSTYLCCPDAGCGWVLQCRDCDAAMVVHRGSRLPAGALVRCHHCLAEQIVPKTCPVCGRRVIELGMGTQRVEDEVVRRFGPGLGLVPGRTLVRVDGDTMRSARDYFETLSRFASGGVKVLLGTQMIAKGLDFPNVRLVGVVNADTALTIPDFRAAERTFQLVSQVAGRAGRGTASGRVIVQTLNPREPAIELAARHDYRAFAEGELRLRRAAGLPPITRMARIVVRDADAGKSQRRAEDLTSALIAAGRDEGGSLRVIGPMPCPISRIAGQHRFAVELLAPRSTDLHRPLHRLRQRGLLTSDAQTAVDVDPVALM